MRTPERWDIFCRVVDNFGDAGVCWRLARQLAHEHGRRVRLWIDDLKSLRRLVPEAVLDERQRIHAVEVNHWNGALMHGVTPADCVIDAFGCGLPQAYADAMTRSTHKSVWIVLEYLTAEPWARDCHGLPSPHPRLPLERYFFFPGFVEGTGGLLREKDSVRRRDSFGPNERDAFWRSFGYPPPRQDAFTASIYAYEHAPLRELLSCWEQGPKEAVVAIPESKVSALALQHFGVASFPSERVLRRGMLEVRLVPFIPQACFDELLWSCDFNFVRGEDSFVRAQWATSPFVWHVYSQSGDAHVPKLESFLDLYCRSLSTPARSAVGAMMRFWNQADPTGVSVKQAWSAFESHHIELRRHASMWAAETDAVGSLTDNLVSFCQDKLK